MALTKAGIATALRNSITNGGYYDVDGPFGWLAKMVKLDDTKYEATMFDEDTGLTIQLIVRAEDDVEAAAIGAFRLNEYHDDSLYPKRPSETIFDWYRKTCPTDPERWSIEVGPSFAMYLAELAKSGNPYIFGIDDSIVRQRVMDATAHVMGLRYDYLSDLIK